ncbi:GAF domain-containing protein [Myceligenerans cantabricum]
MLARSLAKVDADRPFAMRLCVACVDILRAQGGALTIAVAPDERVSVSTPGMFDQLEPLQEVVGEGPVRQAMVENRLVSLRVGGGVEDDPVFSQLAGPLSSDVTVYAVPMRGGGRVVGVFSVYVTTEPQFRSPEDLQFLADAVGASLLGGTESLDWSERARIHQATGMVVAQLRIHPDDALAVIRAHAFSRSTSLLAVAQDVLDRQVTFSPDEASGGTTERTEEP